MVVHTRSIETGGSNPPPTMEDLMRTIVEMGKNIKDLQDHLNSGEGTSQSGCPRPGNNGNQQIPYLNISLLGFACHGGQISQKQIGYRALEVRPLPDSMHVQPKLAQRRGLVLPRWLGAMPLATNSALMMLGSPLNVQPKPAQRRELVLPLVTAPTRSVLRACMLPENLYYNS
ncbi:hypothetical protein CTI12_AA170730 [Artemisia annua]|uniref:Uncharacterized protein n=1 Tax=Artemisia annua TaxID=35608 RepID=A0A2U1MH13_ARTAN|nr:hypothetical protein CTI12_AA170730 [Artemisia annua]